MDAAAVPTAADTRPPPSQIPPDISTDKPKPPSGLLENHKIVFVQQGDRVEIQQKAISIWQRIVFLFTGSVTSRMGIDDLKLAKKFFKQTDEEIKRLRESNPKRAQLIEKTKKMFAALKGMYGTIEGESAKAMVLRNDILEALSVAFGENKELYHIDRIAAPKITAVGEEIKSHQVPLFRAEDMVKVQELFATRFPNRDHPPTLKQVCDVPDLKKYLVVEEVALGRLVDWMYEHKMEGKFFRFGNWCLTKVASWLNRRELPEGEARTEKVAKFFEKMHISISTAFDEKLYSYSEIHGREFRDEKSLDAAFQRPISTFATNLFTRDAQEEKKKVQAAIGDQGSVVISNSFCRLRTLDIPEGAAGKKFHITSKVLNQAQENVDAASTEQGYGGKFLFSVKNMLGNEDEVDISGAASEPVVRESMTQQDAEYLLRTHLTNAVDREAATMVVQRLAPADIHHYTEPVGGKVLSLAEAAEELKKRLPGSSAGERAQLEKLIGFFQDSSKDKCIAEVKGTRMSVSTLATKYQSPLSQNDRKVMVVRHDDGSIAIHTFIGAVGVNNVNVTAHANKYTLGEDTGSMGFGDDEKGRDDWMGMATQEDSIRIRGQPQQVRQGQELGHFDKTGSTVISIYFKKDFRVSDELEAATSAIRYEDDAKGGVQREIEIQAHMGLVIGYPTRYMALQAVEKALGGLEKFVGERAGATEDIVDEIIASISTLSSEKLGPGEAQVLEELKAGKSSALLENLKTDLINRISKFEKRPKS